jgi:hypothetical protein
VDLFCWAASSRLRPFLCGLWADEGELARFGQVVAEITEHPRINAVDGDEPVAVGYTLDAVQFTVGTCGTDGNPVPACDGGCFRGCHVLGRVCHLLNHTVYFTTVAFTVKHCQRAISEM